MTVSVPVDSVGAFVSPPSLLAAGASSGPLAGTTLAVKDLFDVAGTVTGAGNPTFAAGRAPAATNSPAVQRLVDAGATVVGKTITDELAFSLSGTNVHFGTPVNVAAPGRIPGGSSAGSAAAVAAGLVDLALGTDTGGSIRVPASYCGIFGWRPTHGAVPMGGVVPLSPSFDTAGLFARDSALLAAAAAVLLAAEAPVTAPTRPLRLLAEALDDVPPGVADAVRAATAAFVDGAVSIGVDLDAAFGALRPRQTWEAWQSHGAWITAARPEMGPGVASRFTAGSAITTEEVEAADAVGAGIAERVRAATADGTVLVLPAAAGAAPSLHFPATRRAPASQPTTTGNATQAAPRTAHEDQRTRTLRLTCLAGLAGAPVVVLPLATVVDDGAPLPLGVALLGARGSDLDLLALAAELASVHR